MKHPLLPASYNDVSIQSAIIAALAPYKLTVRTGIARAEVQWDLQKAWNDCQPMLETAHWRCSGEESKPTSEWWFVADSDYERDNLTTLVAGLVARQIKDEEEGFAIRRLRYHQGGEIELIIANPMKQLLQGWYPNAHYEWRGEEGSAENIFARIAAWLSTFFERKKKT